MEGEFHQNYQDKKQPRQPTIHHPLAKLGLCQWWVTQIWAFSLIMEKVV